jgi:putative ABC transport system permease protein
MQFVIPGYFATMRTPLLAGRDFNASDHNPHSRLVIIDRLFSAKAFPSGNAVGQRIILSRINSPATNEWYNIVGVVAHQRLTSLAEPGREQVYIPIETLNFQAAQAWAVRTTRDPASYATSVRTEMAKFDRSMLLTDMQTMDSVVQRAQTGTRFSLYLIAAFAVSAALLASVGLYGVLSTVVRQRTVEIGVRMALGASPAGILGLVVAYGLRLSALGLGAGFIAAFLLTRVMTAMLVGIQPTDPPTFAAMAALFFLIAALASWIPARRAATLEPSSALREG